MSVDASFTAVTTESPVDGDIKTALVDRRVQEAAHRALCDSGHRGLSHVNVSVWRGEVRLTGHVRSYYAKQIATFAVLQVDGVAELQNNIMVRRKRRHSKPDF